MNKSFVPKVFVAVMTGFFVLFGVLYLAGCATAPPPSGVYSESGDAYSQSNNVIFEVVANKGVDQDRIDVTRFEDVPAGVVCWVYSHGAYRGEGNMFCLSKSQTLLR